MLLQPACKAPLRTRERDGGAVSAAWIVAGVIGPVESVGSTTSCDANRGGDCSMAKKKGGKKKGTKKKAAKKKK
jgi:hypothetical protein